MNEARGLLSEKLVAEEQTLYDSLYKVSKTVNLEKPSREVVSRAAGRGRAGLLLGWEKVSVTTVKPGLFPSMGSQRAGRDWATEHRRRVWLRNRRYCFRREGWKRPRDSPRGTVPAVGSALYASSAAQSRPTLVLRPWDSQARVLEGFAISSSSGPSQPRGWTRVSCAAGEFFTPEPPASLTALKVCCGQVLYAWCSCLRHIERDFRAL